MYNSKSNYTKEGRKNGRARFKRNIFDILGEEKADIIYSINVYSNRNWIFIFFSKTYI